MDKNPLEETPLTDFSPEAKEVRERLHKAPDQYKNARPADLPQPLQNYKTDSEDV